MLQKRNRSVKLALECLEDRTVPASFSFYGSGYHDVYEIRPDPGVPSRTVITQYSYADPAHTQFISSSWSNPIGYSEIIIYGYGGDDVFNVRPDVYSSLTLHGMSGNDVVQYWGRSTAEGITVTATNVYGPSNVYFDYVESLMVDTLGGNDSVSVLSTAIPTTITSGGGRDAVTVGDVGSVQGIRGLLTIKNPPVFTDLTIDNNRDTVSRSALITASSITGLAPAAINYVGGDLASLTIKGGKAVYSSYSFDGTPSSSISGGLTTLFLGGPNRDDFHVRASQGALVLMAGAGDDNVYVGSILSDPVALLDMVGPVTVNGGTGMNGLYFNDRDTFGPHSYLLTGTSFQRSGKAPVQYSNMGYVGVSGGREGNNDITVTASALPGMAQATVSLAGGSRYNTFHVTLPPNQINVYINVENGFNTVYGPDADTTWQLGAIYNQTAEYSTVGVIHVSIGWPYPNYYTSWLGTMVGGSGDDLFIFTDELITQGTVDGGAGNNTLDYSHYTSDIYVHLRNGITPNLTSFSEIQNVTGGSGNDILLGNDSHHALSGGPGRDILIAGVSWGYLLGGADDDIVIAGTTAYDDDDASLFALRDYWTSADDYDTRVYNLTTGNGVPLLDASTVYSNGGNNQLLGQGGTDLFFTLIGYDVILDLINGEVEVGLI